MTTVAIVKFDGTRQTYGFACNITNLTKGEVVEVETTKAIRPATFIGYTDHEMIGFEPTKKVLGRVAKLTGKTFSSGTRVRSKEQREFEAKKLRELLQENHPTMLSTRDIAEGMGWNVDQTSGFVKTSMGLENKIVQVYKGWYTAKL